MQDVHARRVVAMAERISAGLPVDTDNPPSGPQRYPKQSWHLLKVKGLLANLHLSAGLLPAQVHFTLCYSVKLDWVYCHLGMRAQLL